MAKLQIGRFSIEYYDDYYRFNYHQEPILTTTLTTVVIKVPKITCELDYEHLDWLSQVWGFKWHERFDLFKETPF